MRLPAPLLLRGCSGLLQGEACPGSALGRPGAGLGGPGRAEVLLGASIRKGCR